MRQSMDRLYGGVRYGWALGAGCLFLLACGEAPTEEVRSLRPVRSHTVGFAGGEASRTFSGTAETGSIINLSFRSGGVVTRLDVRVGQEVERGQLLARLDNVGARLAYEQAVASLNSAASQMNTAQLSLDRARTLYEKGTASLSEYENAKNSFTSAEASHQSAQRSVEIQRDQINYGFIYASAAGTIAAVNAEVNENVSAGQTIGVLNVGGSMEIALGLPESVINRIQEGMPVTIAFPALADVEFEGLVTEVSPSVDANTATYPVRVSVAGSGDDIRTGMSANVTFELGNGAASSTVLVVPANAVGEDGDGRFVFVLEPGGDGAATVRKQHVTVGPLTAEGFEIRDGLSEGRVIATAGLSTLLDGQQVRLQ